MKSNRLFLMFATIVAAATGATVLGQQPAPPTPPPQQPAPAQPAPSASPLTVKGTLDIKYNSRTQVDDSGKPKEGVKDVYTVDLGVTGLNQFQGQIEHLPSISGRLYGERQQSTLTYNLTAFVVNPKDLSQRVAVGKLVGGVPIDQNGVYQYGNGTLRMAIDARGGAQGFESKFLGQAAGKPPKSESLLAKTKNKAKTITKSLKGKTVKLVLTDYDTMEYVDLVLPEGPVKAYPNTKVNGKMLYDYERDAWYFDGVTMTYTGSDGKVVTDTLSGNIKWLESPQRSSNGEGEYQFDVRVNEPANSAGEDAAFQDPSSEADFFTTDTSLACLTGTAKYKDQMRSDETVTASAVTINLTGNSLTKTQVVNLTKLIWLVNVVPMNSE